MSMISSIRYGLRLAVSLWSMRPIIIIALFIGGHLGRDKTREKVSSRFFWKTLMKDVDEFVKTCDVCQSTNGAKFIKRGIDAVRICFGV